MISLAEFAKWYLTYISGQPYSRLTFATELLLAEILFMWPYKRSRLFGVRAAASFLLYVAIAYFFPEAALHMGSYVTILVFVCSVALHALCSGYSFKKVAFNCIAAYAVQNFIVNLRICIMGTFAISESYRIVVELCCAVAVFAGAYLLFARKNSREEEINITHVRLMILTVAVIVLVDLMVKVASAQGVSGNVVLRLCMACTDLLALFLQFSTFRVGKLETENAKMEMLLLAEQEQYKMSRETIDLVNMKCHDLKHRLARIRSGRGGEEEAELWQDVEEAVLFYENVAKTGNDALDSVLTQKVLMCEKRNISFSYMADGSALSAVKPSDVYSLFGNALDNAIEGVMREEDPEKRFIFLRVGQKGGMISIHVENYCSRPPVFEDGLPRTTKQDAQNHGIGVRSIRYIAEKYGGHARFDASDELFCLNVMLPV